MAAAAGAIISVLVEEVKNYALSFVGDGFLEVEVRNISDALESIQPVLEAIERMQTKSNAVHDWLEKLKDVAYDMEDALDEYVVGGLAGEYSGNPRRRWASPVVSSPPRAIPDFHQEMMAQRLESIKERLEEITRKREDVSLTLRCWRGGASQGLGTTMSSWETTAVLNKEWTMVGRERIQAEIKREILLNSTAEPKILIIAMVGMGGIGKTALAQAIFNDEDIPQQKFPVRRWLYVGDAFDATRLIKGIIRDGSNIHHLGDLQSKLMDEIREDRFFIVLDDVWSENSEEWDTLWKPLSHGSKGGVVVVTTRSRRVAQTKRPVSVHSLKEMSDEECMEIFERCAFEGKDMEEYPHLEELCEQIVQKLRGVPLAAKMMGGYLGRYLDDVKKWRSVINDAEWALRYGEDLVDRVVGLSYYRLPPHLKPCFAYCSTFPKGYEFHKKRIVQKWIAQGYIQAHGNQLEEHTGSEYFEDLHHRSFFQLDSWGNYYLMHDLVHDFARNVFSEGCQVTIGRDSVASSKSMQVRHLSISGDELETANFMELHKFKKLRTFYLDCWKLIDSPLDLFEKFKYIRVLELSSWSIKEFPESIRHLRFLRYLDIQRTGIRGLPELVCDLLNLQVLKLGYGCALPAGMSKLVNLRHLQAGRKEITGIKGIGKLTCLQRLELFRVGNESEWGIRELKDLNHLHKELTICSLEKVTNKEEAELACLKDKVYLEGLVLEWGEYLSSDESMEVDCWGRDQESEDVDVLSTDDEELEESESLDVDDRMGEKSMGVDSQVLEGLHPPPHLKSLMVLNNQELRLPNWMRKMLPSTLVKVELRGCRNWECIPTLGQLQSLKELDILEAHNVKKIGPEFYGVDDSSSGRGNEEFFPRLESLCFTRMGQWEEWGMPVEENDDRRVFPSLKNLRIFNCPRLASLTPILRHMTALEKLRIRDCNDLVSLEERDGQERDGRRWAFPSLIGLAVFNCHKLASLAPILCHMTTALKELYIRKCDELVSLEEGDGHGCAFPSLNKVKIEECPKLTSLSPVLRHMTALEELYISNCYELASLEEGDGHGWAFTSLIDLAIFNCHKLASLAPILRHMTALKELRIRECHELVSLEKRDEHGWAFPSFKKVTIEECPRLASLTPILGHMTALENLGIRDCNELVSLEEGGGDGWAFPSLHSINIESCPKLATLSPILRHMTALRELRISRCDELAMLGEVNGDGWEFPSLSKVNIFGCPKLKSLSPLLPYFTSLKCLTITSCSTLWVPAITCIGSSSRRRKRRTTWSLEQLLTDHRGLLAWILPDKFPSLKELVITGCDQLRFFTRTEQERLKHHPSLRELKLSKCHNLESLPSNLNTLHVLQELQLEDCPAVQCLPEGGLSDSLRELWITGCPLLKERCREGGPDHPKIPTTTTVYFD